MPFPWLSGCLKCPSSSSLSCSALARQSQRITTPCRTQNIPMFRLWVQQKMLVMSNETHRHVADQFEFAFLNDGEGIRLFQGGVKVCSREQQYGQGDKVHWEGEASPICQQKHQADCRGRSRSGRDCGCRCPSGCSVKVPRGSQP